MKKSGERLYLSAREAASELSISAATLYAYVSRGLIRSEPTDASRERRYRAEDVRALKARRGPAGAQRGDAEPALIDSAVSTIDESGPIYRGVRAVNLAAEASLEVASPSVSVVWRRSKNRVDIWVEDAGPGLPDTANLFVPFFTTKAGGSGIGLVLCRQIAEAHEGALTLENRKDARGTRATLTLPA